MRFAFLTDALRGSWFAPSSGAAKARCAPHVRARRILILSVSAGAGHTRAAEALACCANADEALLATHVDVMNFVAPAFRALYVDLYLKLVSHYPTLWGLLYRHMQDADRGSMLQKLRRRLERFFTRRLQQEIRRQQPDLIICTHFLPAEILAHGIAHGAVTPPVWVQVTDFDVHPLWVQPGMAGYFAANAEVAFRMQAQGLAAERILVSGIPLMPAFGAPPARHACARELGLDPQRMTLLLMGGGAGLGGLDRLAQQLLGMDADFQLIVMAGKNIAALRRLQTLARDYPGRLIAQGFTDKVERIMACADLVITKPGGLTSAECLALGLPMIIHAAIPGQEERNADYLLEQGVALKAADSTTLEYRIRTLLDNPGKLIEMRANARAIGQADAAQRVIGRVVGKFST